MHNLLDNLKRKGPGGVPLWAYAAGTAVILYLGYRWFANRGGSSRSSSSGSSSNDGTSDGSISDPSSVDGGATPMDGPFPPDSTTDTNPPAGDSTGIINGPESIGEPSPAKKKKAHKGPHDHKQGVHHTKKRAIHRRKPGHTQTPHAHAPKKKGRESSRDKGRRTKGVAHPIAQSARVSRITTPPPNPKVKVSKVAPPAIRLPEEPRGLVAKAPPKTAAARRKKH